MKKIKTKMVFQAIEMTPEFAQTLLDKLHPNQRRQKKHRVEQYCRDNMEGVWRLTHQAVAVDEDGWTIDGQNRCAACVRSGMPMPVMFVTGVPRDAFFGIDCGANRNVSDAAKIAGVDLPHGATTFAGVARMMRTGLAKNKALSAMTIQGTLAFIKHHREAIEFAFTVMPKNKRFLTQSPVRAVIARAWYRRNSRTRIAQFAEVYMTGLPFDVQTDQAAIRLRTWIMDTMASRGNQPSQKVIYAKTEVALKAFLEKEPMERLNATNEELFPLPEEGETNGEPLEED